LRLPKGSLICLEKETDIPKTQLCDYIAGRKRPGRERALSLEKACRKLGFDVSAMVWLYGTSDEIKSGILQNDGAPGEKRKNQCRIGERRQQADPRVAERRKKDRRKAANFPRSNGGDQQRG